MQFQVPQFIETEDTIIGPLTIKQFAYVAGGGLVVFIFYFILQFWLWLIVGGVVGVFVAALAFFRYNGRSFMVLAVAMFSHFWQPRFYLWQSSESIKAMREAQQKEGGLSILGFKLNTFTRPLTERSEKSLQPSVLDRFRGATKERYEVFRKITGDREVAKRVDYR